MVTKPGGFTRIRPDQIAIGRVGQCRIVCRPDQTPQLADRRSTFALRTGHHELQRLRNECTFCRLKERNGVRPNEKLSWLRSDGVCNCPYDCSGWGQRLHQRSSGWRRCRTRCRSPRIARRGGRLRNWSSRSLEKREEESESEPAVNLSEEIRECYRHAEDCALHKVAVTISIVPRFAPIWRPRRTPIVG